MWIIAIKERALSCRQTLVHRLGGVTNWWVGPSPFARGFHASYNFHRLMSPFWPHAPPSADVVLTNSLNVFGESSTPGLYVGEWRGVTRWKSFLLSES